MMTREYPNFIPNRIFILSCYIFCAQLLLYSITVFTESFVMVNHPIMTKGCSSPHNRMFKDDSDRFLSSARRIRCDQLINSLYESRMVDQEEGQCAKDDDDEVVGIYRPFAEYAWKKLESSNLLQVSLQNEKLSDATSSINNSSIPEELTSNTSPAKGMNNANVSIEIKASFPSQNTENNSPLRYGRYALIETLPAEKNDDEQVAASDIETCLSNGIHVLNLVLFPNPSSSMTSILGMDLVSLPGGKHLIAIDFQPFLSEQEESSSSSSPTSIGEDIRIEYEQRLKKLHEKHVLNQEDILPWGGDIPGPAKRFFSPYALWTRLRGKEGLDAIQNQVYAAFCDYLDLYLEWAGEIAQHSLVVDEGGTIPASSEEQVQGHRDYLTYRQENDPARPMLTRLYGEEWTERVISEVLFQMI